MDLEAPADAWYVWFGVVLVTLAFAGVALSFPSEPAPDATQAANTIDEVAASSFNASATYNHNAGEVAIGLQQISMRNSGGTNQETIAFGTMTPVREHDLNEGPDIDPAAVLDILCSDASAEQFTAVFSGPDEMADWADDVHENLRENDGPDWRPANGQLCVKHIHWGGVNVIFVDA